MRQTGLNRVRVDQEILKFVSNGIIRREKIDGEIVYGKDPFYAHNRDKILRFTQDKKKFEKFPTKINPKILAATIAIRLPRQMSKVKRISVDDIESFAQVRVQPHNLPVRPVREGWVKDGIRKLLGEQGDFRDWGGEQDDFGSSRLLMNGRRVTAAFAFKGQGTKGKLTPAKMGKNGDQIPRLLKVPADIYFIQYWNQVDNSTVDLLDQLAHAKAALEAKEVLYCVIDGEDTQRLISAYPSFFEVNNNERD